MKRLQLLKHPAMLLGLISLIGLGLVMALNGQTHPRIAANERTALLRTLETMIPPNQFDNDLIHDTLTLEVPDFPNQGPITVYRARQQNRTVAAILMVTAPDGYNGAIRMLIAIEPSGTLSGVQVISHRETPGLGDLIDSEKSDWIHGFDHRSLGNPPEPRWKVKRDGGDFDQLTGATITPRAVVNAVRNTQVYFSTHQAALFQAKPSTLPVNKGMPTSAPSPLVGEGRGEGE